LSDRSSEELSDLISRLTEARDEHAMLSIGDDAVVVVSAGTGRLFGPFFGGEDPIGWMPPAFGSEGGLERLRESADWNVGGERLWLSPELEYFVADRHDFWNTYAVPPSIDPGAHHLSKSEAGLRLTSQLTLASARTGAGQDVEIARTITPEPAPADLPPTVRAVRYSEEITIDSAADGPPVVPWIVRQVQLEGRVLVPARPGARARSIVGPLPHDAKVATIEGFAFSLAEGHMFKVAFPAREIAPAIAYVLPRGEGTAAVVMSFDGTADSAYFEEPPDRPGDNGYSAFVFRDDGRFGGYGELEVVGRPEPGSGVGRKRSCLTLTVTTLFGPSDVLTSTVSKLLPSRA
jgi:hypothetical protein